MQDTEGTKNGAAMDQRRNTASRGRALVIKYKRLKADQLNLQADMAIIWQEMTPAERLEATSWSNPILL